MTPGFDPVRAVGAASVELRFAAAELRTAAASDVVGDRGVLYTLADRLDRVAQELQDELPESPTGEMRLHGAQEG